MSHTPQNAPDAKASEVASLRQQLTDSDRKRRALLAELFLSYSKDTSPVIKMLFAEVPSTVLEKVERLLLEGGEL